MGKKRKEPKRRAAAVCKACGKEQPAGVVLHQPGDLCDRCYRHAEEAVKGRQPLPKVPATPGHIPDDLAGEIFARLDDVKVRRIEFDAATEHRKGLRASLEEAQTELEKVLDDARSGQTRLFEQPATPAAAGSPGGADGDF